MASKTRIEVHKVVLSAYEVRIFENDKLAGKTSLIEIRADADKLKSDLEVAYGIKK